MKPRKPSSRRTVKKTVNVLVIHGPNLNLLGEREPEVYGRMRLAELDRRLQIEARKLGARLRIRQLNGEGEIIDLIHRERRWAQAIVINPAAYTHYSYAIRDALAAVALPAVEVHLSDISKREPFRRVSVVRPVCVGQVSGLGWRSYAEGLKLALEAARDRPLSAAQSL